MMQRAAVSKPALGYEDRIEGDDCYYSCGNEEGLECMCADV
jgi:hypothetical protein